MRKIILIQILFLLFLAGCGKSKVTVSEITDNQCVENAYFNEDTSIVESEKGYYILHNSYGGFYLTYKSKDRDEEIFLCNKPECKHIHDDISDPIKYMTMYEDCNAKLGEEGILNSLKMDADNLYVLMHEEGEAVLYRISKDGSAHDRLFSLGPLSSNTTGTYGYIVSGESVYVLYFPEKYQSGEAFQVIQYAKDGSNKKVLYEDSEHMLMRMMLYNGGLFLRRCDNQTGVQSQICRLDINSGKLEVIAGEHAVKYTIDNINNDIYYWEMGKGLVKYDLNTGAETLIRESDSSMLTANIACNSKYVFLDNSIGRYYHLDNEASQNSAIFVEVLDIQTGKMVDTIEIPQDCDIVSNCDEDNVIFTNLKDYIFYKIEDIKQ